MPTTIRSRSHLTRRAYAVLAPLAALLACTRADDPVTPGAGEEEGPPSDVSYQFGAKFEPPAGRVVHGIGQWHVYNEKYFALLPPNKQPASALIYVEIGDTPRGWRPGHIAEQFAEYDAAGRIPHVEIALRGLQPPPDSLSKLPDPYYGIDHEVANGTRYNGRIEDLIQIVKAYGKPVMMRIGGEFNGPWNGYHPYEYPKAFRKIVTMFRQAGADNVAFIWCYEPGAPADFAEKNAAGEYRWYPGADVIDWYSVDLFAAADVAEVPGGGRPGADGLTPHERVLAFLDMAVADGKPVTIAESAPSRYDFADAGQAEAAWAEWFQPFFQLIADRPEIEWFHYINYDWTQASFYSVQGWKNNDLAASPALAEKYVAEISKPKYLHADEKHLLKDYTKYR